MEISRGDQLHNLEHGIAPDRAADHARSLILLIRATERARGTTREDELAHQRQDHPDTALESITAFDHNQRATSRTPKG